MLIRPKASLTKWIKANKRIMKPYEHVNNERLMKPYKQVNKRLIKP